MNTIDAKKNAMDKQSPFFLVGAERSGTTMLRLMLTHHPEMFFHHEFIYSVKKINESGEFPSIDDYLAYLETDRIFQVEKLNIIDSDDYVEIVTSFLSQLHERYAQKSVVGATVHGNFQFLPKIWPNAKFIHLIRDPRDVTFSYVQKGWAGHVWTAADVWSKTEVAWQDFSCSLAPEDFINVYYEDLVLQPVEELKRICQFMGCDFSNEMLTYEMKSSYSAPDKSLINQWKNRDQEKIKLIEYKLKDLMVQYGYSVNKEEFNVGFLYNHYLKVISRINKIIFATRRYGVLLKLLDFISRKVIKNNKFRVFIKRKIDSIDNLYIK